MSDKRSKKLRIAFTIFYLILAILIIAIRSKSMFYYDALDHSFNLDRYLWSVASALLGFSFLSYRVIEHSNSPFPSFIVYYPILLLIIAAISFSFCHAFQRTSGFVYYYLSFSISFCFGFLVDRFWDIISKVVQLK
jgi:hypothetical protein